MPKRATGITKKGDIWHIDKQIRNYGRLCESTGTTPLEETRKEMMSAVQAANFLGISARLIYSLAAQASTIPCYRIGKRLSFDEQELQQYTESCRYVQFKTPTPTLSRTFPKLKVTTLWLKPGESDL